jgi:hypothetical protein
MINLDKGPSTGSTIIPISSFYTYERTELELDIISSPTEILCIQFNKRGLIDSSSSSWFLPGEVHPPHLEEVICTSFHRTAPDRVSLLASTKNVLVPYYRSEASAIAIWWCFYSKLDGIHLIPITCYRML